MKKNLYFEEGTEYAYDKEHLFEKMANYGVSEMICYKAIRDKTKGIFYCKAFGEVGEKDGTCGRECGTYKPRNGKSGICSHQGACYEYGDKVMFRIKKSITKYGM